MSTPALMTALLHFLERGTGTWVPITSTKCSYARRWTRREGTCECYAYSEASSRCSTHFLETRRVERPLRKTWRARFST
ncbi:hypothetical protein BD310DRAFT_939238 [Dichomitus squalens]|uniref:Secreted protein n=1 Tax=Dichomitus squalens TaxID=114155 RepID=A0A4Q9PDF2_9APHY|nr:hypothetical protein BD310DRAFT_939238 [Dichomitus squalens]